MAKGHELNFIFNHAIVMGAVQRFLITAYTIDRDQYEHAKLFIMYEFDSDGGSDEWSAAIPFTELEDHQRDLALLEKSLRDEEYDERDDVSDEIIDVIKNDFHLESKLRNLFLSYDFLVSSAVIQYAQYAINVASRKLSPLVNWTIANPSAYLNRITDAFRYLDDCSYIAELVKKVQNKFGVSDTSEVNAAIEETLTEIRNLKGRFGLNQACIDVENALFEVEEALNDQMTTYDDSYWLYNVMKSGTNLKNSIYYAKRAILANQVMEYQYADAVKAFNVSAQDRI